MKFVRIKLDMIILVDDADQLPLLSNVNDAAEALAIALKLHGKYIMPGALIEIGFAKPKGVPGSLTREGLFNLKADPTPSVPKQRRRG